MNLRNIAVLCILAVGCDPNETCQDPVAKITSSVPDFFNGDSLVLSGVVEDAECLVEDVRVCSVPVTAKRDNFVAWEVTLTRKQLESCASDPTGARRLAVEIFPTNATQAAAAVETIDLVVSGLSIVPLGEDCHFPADESAGQGFEISANASANGAKVAVTASIGKLSGLDSDGTVTLRTVGEETRAQVTVFADKPGELVVTAAPASGPAAASAPRRAVAAPVIFPTGLVVPRGVKIAIEASTRGRLARCSIFETSPSLSTATFVESGGEEYENPSAKTCAVSAMGDADVPLNDTVTMNLEFDAAAPKGAAVQLRCEDSYPSLATSAAFVVSDP